MNKKIKLGLVGLVAIGIAGVSSTLLSSCKTDDVLTYSGKYGYDAGLSDCPYEPKICEGEHAYSPTDIRDIYLDVPNSTAIQYLSWDLCNTVIPFVILLAMLEYGWNVALFNEDGGYHISSVIKYDFSTNILISASLRWTWGDNIDDPFFEWWPDSDGKPQECSGIEYIIKNVKFTGGIPTDVDGTDWMIDLCFNSIDHNHNYTSQLRGVDRKTWGRESVLLDSEKFDFWTEYLDNDSYKPNVTVPLEYTNPVVTGIVNTFRADTVNSFITKFNDISHEDIKTATSYINYNDEEYIQENGVTLDSVCDSVVASAASLSGDYVKLTFTIHGDPYQRWVDPTSGATLVVDDIPLIQLPPIPPTPESN